MSEHNCGIWYQKIKRELIIQIKKRCKNIFFKNIFKIGYRYFSVKKRHKNDRNIIKTFQQRYLPKKSQVKLIKKHLKLAVY